jgi:serine-type D-Ala-D-Ala carboxypeptidase/endopeptidase (penicillin-binding protein 4)
MKQYIIIIISLLLVHETEAQRNILACKQAAEKLSVQQYMKYGVLAVSVRNASTGEIVYSAKGDLGMQGASTQKIFTAVSAYEILGAAHRYTTKFFYEKRDSSLTIEGNYDPTMGSWRYTSTIPDRIGDSLRRGLAGRPISKVRIAEEALLPPYKAYSNTWILEDIGNYFGAPCSPLMWRENQFEAILVKDKGQKYVVQRTEPPFVLQHITINSAVQSGPEGSGDKTCTYTALGNVATPTYTIAGQYGTDQHTFAAGISIEGASYFTQELQLRSKKIHTVAPITKIGIKGDAQCVHTHYSPTLDSINYWFLKKSINLYGEALTRTLSHRVSKTYDLGCGISQIYKVAHQAGIDSAALHFFDGCGLSPSNKLTANSLSQILHYARSRKYFDPFYMALPIINDLSMKSGSIHRVRAYAGYVNSSDGNIYSFAIIANNYSCSGIEMQSALWHVLDYLK